jgi:wyosine [tRNA(Phe)-imidazoG37] synthetase (radical SAM superfamily)
VGVNLTPDRQCNFDCVYCEVSRKKLPRNGEFDVDAMAAELADTLERVQQGRLKELPWYNKLPPDLLELKHVALSGEGEPTLCDRFAEAVQAVVHIRARGQFPFFKIVLFTNASVLNEAQVQYGLKFLIHQDELWLKLDAGSPEHMSRINRPHVPFEKILRNICSVARRRPVVIQSLFPMLQGQEPSEAEVEQYAKRLNELKNAGAQISLVQIYSATRPTAKSECRHLPLRSLSRIAHRVRDETGLDVDVF